jgi:ribose transport system substrate-binding protein
MNRSILVLLVLLAGCNRASDSPSAPQKPRVALIMKSLANEFFSTMRRGAEEHQAEHSHQYDLIVNGIKDENDVIRQVALVNEMIALNVDAIVIAPAQSQSLVPVLRKAIEAGIVVINIDNRLDADVLEAEGIDVPFVGPDNRAGAAMVGEYLADKLSEGDAVAILEGIRGTYNSEQRVLGFRTAMEQWGMKVVDSQSAQWESGPANTIASSMLSEHPEIKAILAANDSMAMGAVAAVRASGKTGEVQIVGFDNIPAIQQAIRDGKVLATADQYADKLAAFGIEYALKRIDDPQAEVQDRETPVVLITAADL